MRPLKIDANGHPMPVFNPGDADPIIVADGNKSDVIDDTYNTVLRLYAEDDCNIAMGADPTASATTIPLPGGVYTDLVCQAGYKVAVLGSDLYIMIHQE